MSVFARAAQAAPPPPKELAAVLDAGGQELRTLLEQTEQRLRDTAQGHGPELTRHAGETLSAGGKRLRPMLVFICAGGRGSPSLLDAAVAVELLHMATLVHDDVLDRATLRRGHPTVFAAGGVDAATATGDLLFSRAFAELVRTGSAESVRALSAASSALARGELMQRADAWSGTVTRARYIERCELKTARLFEAACRLGALLGEPGPAAAGALGAYGSRIGVAFQIFDDVLDVAGPTERTGKLRGADLLDGTVTLPLILARRRDRRLADQDLRQVVTGPAQAEAFCDRIALTGALEEAREQARVYVDSAKAALEGIPLSERQRTTLELVADGVVERYS
ncbi:MAG: octaprenyl diphosphate synthase [Thermoleophilaceae bacterium]